MWFLLTPLLFKYNRYCHQRFGKAVQRMPLETAAAAAEATVDPIVYLPPALRSAAALLLLPVLWQPVCSIIARGDFVETSCMQLLLPQQKW